MRRIFKPSMLRGRRFAGRGMGSILLRRGGPGGGSSYDGVEDYVKTTGVKVRGMGLKDVSEKLQALAVEPLKKKTKTFGSTWGRFFPYTHYKHFAHYFFDTHYSILYPTQNSK